MSRKRAIGFVAALGLTAAALPLVALPLGAQTPVTTTPTTQTQAQDRTVQREHVVKTGDTLWDLAQFYYGNPYLWKIIYDANKPVVENPHWIYPVEKLIIPGLKPADTALGTPVQAPIEVSIEPLTAPKDTTPTVLATVDTRRPLITALEYMTAPWLSLDPAPGLIARLVRVADPTTGDDKIPALLYPNIKVLLGDVRGNFRKGDSVQIVRLGKREGTYGRVIEPLGILRVDSVGSTVVAATMVKQFGTAKIGDYIMSLGSPPSIPRGDYTAVQAGSEGQLIDFMSSRSLYGPGDLAFVSIGNDKVRIGDELVVYTPEQKIDNERPDLLPKTTVGVVRVVKVTDHSATVRVMSLTNTGMRNGLSARLVRRAP